MSGIDIATVNSRQVGLLQARNAAHRRTNIGSAWNEARLGLFIAVTPSGNNDAAVTPESFTPSSYLDSLTIGLKDSSVNPPRKAGSQFMGMMWPDRNGLDTLWCTSNSAGVGAINCGTGNARTMFGTANGATVITSALTTGWPITQQASGWAEFLGIRFLVANAGLSTQTVQMFYSTLSTNKSADLSKNALRNSVMSVSWTAAVTANWFSGGVALPLPDYLWIYLPFATNRFRIPNVDVWKIS